MADPRLGPPPAHCQGVDRLWPSPTRGERLGQLAAARDPELAVGVGEVEPDRACGVTNRASAISRLVKPSAASSATRRSPAVSASGPVVRRPARAAAGHLQLVAGAARERVRAARDGAVERRRAGLRASMRRPAARSSVPRTTCASIASSGTPPAWRRASGLLGVRGAVGAADDGLCAQRDRQRARRAEPARVGDPSAAELDAPRRAARPRASRAPPPSATGRPPGCWSRVPRVARRPVARNSSSAVSRVVRRHRDAAARGVDHAPQRPAAELRLGVAEVVEQRLGARACGPARAARSRASRSRTAASPPSRSRRASSASSRSLSASAAGRGGAGRCRARCATWRRRAATRGAVRRR